jgi:hypothetical protein
VNSHADACARLPGLDCVAWTAWRWPAWRWPARVDGDVAAVALAAVYSATIARAFICLRRNFQAPDVRRRGNRRTAKR